MKACSSLLAIFILRYLDFSSWFRTYLSILNSNHSSGVLVPTYLLPFCNAHFIFFIVSQRTSVPHPDVCRFINVFLIVLFWSFLVSPSPLQSHKDIISHLLLKMLKLCHTYLSLIHLGLITCMVWDRDSISPFFQMDNQVSQDDLLNYPFFLQLLQCHLVCTGLLLGLLFCSIVNFLVLGQYYLVLITITLWKSVDIWKDKFSHLTPP